VLLASDTRLVTRPALAPDPRYLPGSELLAPDTRLVTLSSQLVTGAPCTYPAEAPTTLFSPVSCSRTLTRRPRAVCKCKTHS